MLEDHKWHKADYDYKFQTFLSLFYNLTDRYFHAQPQTCEVPHSLLKKTVTIGPTHLLRELLYLSSNSGNNSFPFPKWQLCFRGIGLLDLNNSPLVHNLRDSHNIPHPAMRFHYNPILLSDEDILRWCRTLDFFILKKDPSLTRGKGFGLWPAPWRFHSSVQQQVTAG